MKNEAGIATSLLNLAIVACRCHDYEQARTYLAESLTSRQNLGDKRGIAEALEEFAGLAAALHQGERAACLFGAAEVLREKTGSPISPDDLAEYDKSVALSREALGNEAFAATWNTGRSMALNEAIKYALTTETER